MPAISIYELFGNAKINAKEIDYDFEDTLLESIMSEYDSRMNESNSLIAIGNDVFHTWKVPIGACLAYGDSIKLRHFLVPICIRFKNKEIKIEINLKNQNETVKRLKERIFARLRIPVSNQRLRLLNEDLVNSRPIGLYKINKDSIIKVDYVEEVGGQLFVKDLSGKTLAFQLELQMSVLEVKEKIQDKSDIPVNLQRLIFGVKPLQDDCSLRSYQIQTGSTLHLALKLAGGGFSFVDVTKEAKILEWNKSAPKWRKASMGLCLEGLCQNIGCTAYKQMIVMNMGVPVVFKLGTALKDQKTNCPMCKKYVKPVTCALNNCSWRYLGTKETLTGYENIKGEWQKIGDKYYRFNEGDQTTWSSLIIETKYDGIVPKLNRQCTETLECVICFGSPQKDKTGVALSCKHSFHKSCINEWFKHSGTCPCCRIQPVISCH